jgi:hypothetical protein
MFSRGILLAAYVFEYGMFILAGMMFVWSFALLSNRAFTKRPSFRLFPLIFSIIMFSRVFYSPISITSPASHTIVHPGERVTLTIELRPAFLSTMFPSVGLTLYRCYTCTDWPPGVITEGALTGSPYTFAISIPQSQPAGEMFVDAYASIKLGERAAMRSTGVGLVVK